MTSLTLCRALRRLTTLIVVVGQYVVMRRATPADEVLAVVSMVLGALGATFCVSSAPSRSTVSMRELSLY